VLDELNIYYKIIKAAKLTTYELIEKAHNLGLRGNIKRQYLIYLFLRDENVFSLACEKGQKLEGSSLYDYALADIEILQKVCSDEAFDFKPVEFSESRTNALIEKLEIASAREKLAILMEYYKNSGAGDMACYKMFTLSGDRLKGIDYPDYVNFDDIIGCESQKATLISNTEAFLAGKPANNVLLVGSRGSGKSSCVKALASKYDNLRIVEVHKDEVAQLPALVEKLAQRGKRFIIFMDDLSFEPAENEYKQLKSLLEGGVGLKPDNVLFYATSNRRNIVREAWKDRNSDDDVHVNDTINEKMSLSDRFGLTLYFPHINQEEYLQIVITLAKKASVTDIDNLKTQALQWAVEHKRMSGRTAVQFLHHSGVL